ncbi:SARP family transcriptional regulator [Rhizocola hellebori]|uniref:SARP family transcriptional regulator n=1 Tax=Rhizocola hellebori TaxID=1392758 RepID=A0A8J3QJS8_9ACTN|nr:AfsR/SARP family transcriptional regulator [Rhizocola hellebori]GIH10431.1 SARP family transcriptional regulator [Rhizocola hellebori]
MLRFAVLGPLLVTRDEQPIDLPTAMLRRLVAILLCQPGQPIAIDLLLDALWEGQPPPSARKTLQIYVHRLRRVLGDGRVLRGPTGYTLSLEHAEVDFMIFADLVRAAGEATQRGALSQASRFYGRALELWRGNAFADIPGSAHVVVNHAHRLDEQHVQFLQRYAEIELRLDRHNEILSWLAPAAAANPYLEQLRGQFIVALYRSGRQADALAEYRRLHQQLVDDLGVEPGAELQLLQERMLHNDPELLADRSPSGLAPVGPPIPAQLPPPPPGFIGRFRELEQLDMLLTAGARGQGVTVVALIGMAGVGKTATALHWAHRISHRFLDGQLYANLRSFDPAAAVVSPADVLRGFLGALGITPDRVPTEVEAQTALLRSLLAGREMLIVLDNVLDAAQVRPLLPGTGANLVLLTSRTALTGLVAMEGAHPIALGPLTEERSRQLLSARLGQRRLDAEPDAVRQIVQRCAGLPLALAVIAARAQIDSEQPLATLADGLDAFSHDDPLTDVRAVFSWSYKALTPSAALVFRLSAVHPGPEIAIETVADLAQLSPDRAGGALLELVAAQLFVEAAPGRFAMHDLMRSYAAELAAKPDDELGRARRRLLDHYLYAACDASLALNRGRLPVPLPPRPAHTTGIEFASAAAALEWFAAEHATICRTIELALESDLDGHAWRIAWAISDFAVRQSRWRMLERISRQALEAAERAGDRHGRGYAYRYLGAACAAQDQLELSEQWYHLSLHEFSKADLIAEQALLYNDMSVLFAKSGKCPAAPAREALELSRRAQYLRGEATALNGIGTSYLKAGDYPAALHYGKQALAWHTVLEDDHGVAAAWATIGMARYHLGHSRRAGWAYGMAIAILRKTGRRRHLAERLVELGDLYLAWGEFDKARQAQQEALEIHHTTTDDDGRWDVAVRCARSAAGASGWTGGRAADRDAPPAAGDPALPTRPAHPHR